MNLSYRNQKNAEAVSRFWGKPLDRPEWYKIEASANDQAEILVYDVIGWPYNDAGDLVRYVNSLGDKDILVRLNTPPRDRCADDPGQLLAATRSSRIGVDRDSGR